MPPRVFLTCVALFGFGAILIRLEHAIHGAPSGRRRADWIKYAVYLLLIGGLLAAASAGRATAGLVLAAVALLGAQEIHQAGRRSVGWTAVALLGLLLGLGHLLIGRGAAWLPAFAWVLLVVAATDSFAQLWGRLLGRHRLCPRLSPGKTIEGLAGGVITAALVAVWLRAALPGAASLASPGPLPGSAAARAVVIGLVTAAAAVAGDLAFSAVKRRVGIKDFSTRIPGHGGILDRFDSLSLAAPVSFWVRAWLLGWPGA
jgi:CDP-diglyceride synthetase